MADVLGANGQTSGIELVEDEDTEGNIGDSELANYVPQGFKTKEDFLAYVRKEFMADANFDKLNRDWALEDLKFAAGDQWDPLVKAEREELGRPCLTINVLPQFVGQVIGDRRINKTSVKVVAFKDGTAEVANVRSGLIKSIEAFSRAERVYDAACEDQVTCGISNFRIDLEYAGNDVFDQDIFVRHIPNPLAVVWDRMAIDPTGRDARHCFVTDTVPRDVYEERWPKNPMPSSLVDMSMNDMTAQGWFDKDVVRVTEFWRMIEKPATFALFQDGRVVDVTGRPPAEYMQEVVVDRQGKPKIRKSFRSYAQMHLVTGMDILAMPYEIPVTRLPIIRVEGRVIRVGEDRVRFGLVRFAKDSQRLKNYWRSVAAETIALAPKAVWIAPSDAVEGREDDFRDGHKSGDPLLVYNKNASAPPERVAPAPVPAALLQEAQMNQQDIKDTTGLQDASLGIQSNEVSGKAITARQREGDVATVIYHDNLNAAILEGGDVINQLIPIAYDAIRTVRVIGEDDKQKLMVINNPNDPDSIDVTVGKYDVTLITGPSFTTQRQESADALMTLVQTSPEIMAIGGDIVAKALDFPEAQALGRRIRKTIPPQLLDGEDDEGTPTDPQGQQGGQGAAQDPQAAALQQAALQEQLDQLEHAQNMRQFEQATAEANARKAAADAETAAAQTDKVRAEAAHASVKAKFAAVHEVHTLGAAEENLARGHIEGVHKMGLAERTTSANIASRNQSRGAGSRPAGDRPTGGKKKGKVK